jgi:hypothetical protein
MIVPRRKPRPWRSPVPTTITPDESELLGRLAENRALSGGDVAEFKELQRRLGTDRPERKRGRA